MKRSAVIKSLKIYAIIFMGVSAIELIFALLLALTEVTIYGELLPISNIILDGDLIAIEGAFIWTFLIILMILFLILGISFIKIAKDTNLDSMKLAKFMAILGMLILIISFIKLEYIIIMQKIEVFYPSGEQADTFQALLYNPSITPFSAAALWIFFTAVVCGYLVLGIIMAAGGLKWMLEMEKQNTTEPIVDKNLESPKTDESPKST